MQPQSPPLPPARAARSQPLRWVLLDRDGVINQENPGSYILSPDDWIPIPGSPEAIGRLCAAGLRVVILTNQSAVGRGLLDLPTLEAVHAKLLRTIEDAGGKIAGIFFCPHHPDDGCACRKPKAGLFRQAEEALGCSLEHAPMVGDQPSDLQAAQEAGCRPILVRTGPGHALSWIQSEFSDVPIYDDLAEAVTAILEENQASSRS
ncbi:MAG: D-glycero-beta-D-manno-heptose 1,7-bisphosphate 7-phosphatase [Myxococcota bacterium]|nr:D-glycero-beta-D-manno-heptose 1,7-bisphosphate 7-phosphatase [Myxococcota bacterium]